MRGLEIGLIIVFVLCLTIAGVFLAFDLEPVRIKSLSAIISISALIGIVILYIIKIKLFFYVLALFLFGVGSVGVILKIIHIPGASILLGAVICNYICSVAGKRCY